MPAAPKPLTKPTDWDELYPGRFIKAGELKGKKVGLTIAAVDRERLESDKGLQVKGIISFHETEMGLALNKTNGLCLREMFGRSLTAWVGRRIWIFPDVFEDQPCIRIWGSPDIKAPLQVEIKFPRKKTVYRTMHNTLDGGEAKPSRSTSGGAGTHREVRGEDKFPAEPPLPIPDPDGMDPEPGANDKIF